MPWQVLFDQELSSDWMSSWALQTLICVAEWKWILDLHDGLYIVHTTRCHNAGSLSVWCVSVLFKYSILYYLLNSYTLESMIWVRNNDNIRYSNRLHWTMESWQQFRCCMYVSFWFMITRFFCQIHRCSWNMYPKNWAENYFRRNALIYNTDRYE